MTECAKTKKRLTERNTRLKEEKDANVSWILNRSHRRGISRKKRVRRN